MKAEQLTKNINDQRRSNSSKSGGQELGLLRYLTGTWQNSDKFADRGWSLIALPLSNSHGEGEDQNNYRVLVSQYNETLLLKEADKGVPNRGVIRDIDANLDQTIVALEYEQFLRQVSSTDKPNSGNAKKQREVAIHHELGLWLHILDQHQPGANIAKLGTISHGNSLLALGTAEELGENTTIDIPDVNPFPILTATQVPLDQDSIDRYQELYSAFVAPQGTFFPNGLDLHSLLEASTPTNIKGGVKYTVSTAVATGDIVKVPFIVDQADVVQLNSTFWIYELDEVTSDNQSVMVMQYMQVVMLEYFNKIDSSSSIRWPHVSLNTLVKASASESEGQEIMRSTMEKNNES